MKRQMFMLLFLVTVLTASSRIEGQVSWSAHSPAIRCCMGMSANVSGDSPVSGTLLFGGFDGTSYFADSWIFREGRWIQVIPASSPAARQGPGMAYDAATDTVVLFGGTAADGTDLGDTWIWNGETWTQVLPSVAPSGRRLDTQGMAYDAATQTVLLFADTAMRQAKCLAIPGAGMDRPRHGHSNTRLRVLRLGELQSPTTP
jgi:hypothetical protein